ncbi:hypothetical protein OS493_019855 [Desmophyllum pertusum]|uniref:CTHRC1 C-terminal domain-containing protein n=1 Tax=Desmophyllum pertusum TaxID=174260 RepID=A0A9X0CK51_9CNID|nr:hypothetical protein OS493_019855 [Desmophyllum pertusum]
MAQFVYFATLLVLCGTPGKSLETTTSPQQQNTDAAKDLCEKSTFSHGFPGIPGSNGMPGMPGIPGPQGPQGRDGAKGQTGEMGSQGMLGPKGERGKEGPHGKSGPPGMMGIKGEQGLMGNQGIKGDKGESVRSPSSAVPQTNWKQCVWKNVNDDEDNGKIKDCLFNKLHSDTAIKLSFQGMMRVVGDSKCNRWFFKFNGNECSGPMTIDAVVYNSWSSSAMGTTNLQHHRSFEGYCENIPQGTVRVELWVGQCPSGTLGDAYTGYLSVSRIMIEEVYRPQS